MIELSSDFTLKSEVNNETLEKFWSSINTECKKLSTETLRVLLLLTGTVLVERAFSSYLFIENKYRNKLNANLYLKLYLASIEPNFKKFCAASSRFSLKRSKCNLKLCMCL